ncbi:N-acetylmuramoyl-L-alanine amidase [Streptomyces chartreusis]|uniref:peptidoglycan recognition protein family protein n=1 Tax=Streptomyces chartreusis TaxID=1969 RepID=UPI002E16D85A|nr:N-acetylmuramoyl-L-alanine amidase [Streptomyces chartreusis]
MAWYPGAVKMELQPESDGQPAIRPTQLILHSVIAPWTARRIFEYWRDSSSLESHFGLGYEGDLGQYIGTETRADANAGANRRADGTGAVSIETASNTSGTDPWTAAQIEQLIRLGVWLHQRHGIPLRICRTHNDPGFGYHSMFPQWSTSGTACPGNARIKQFREVVFPGIVARATGQTPEEEDVALTADEIDKIADKVVEKIFKADVINAVAPPDENADWHEGNTKWSFAYAVHSPNVVGRETRRLVRGIEQKVDAIAVGGVDLDALAAKVADLLATRLAN